MNFEKGSMEHPTGNLLVYSHVIGENPVHPGGKILASNVVVSFLKVGENFPVVTFPPVAMDSLEELKKIIADHSVAYDVIRIADFLMPDGKQEADEYIKKRMEQFNSLVMKYVEYCRKSDKKGFVPVSDPDSQEGLTELAKISIEFRNSSGLAKDATRLKVNQVLDFYSIQYPQYDLVNFKKALEFPGERGEELVSLYLKKFEAISNEAYEEASTLKKKINSIETSAEV